MERRKPSLKPEPKPDIVAQGEHPWVDDKFNIKTGKKSKINYHIEIDRNLRCGCESTHKPLAHKLVEQSYKEAINAKIPPAIKEDILFIYGERIEKDRVNERGLDKLDSKQFYEWGKAQ